MPREQIANVQDVPPGTGKEFVVGGRIVALFNVDGRFYAIDGVCAHAGGPLAAGDLAGSIVTCPWHGWQYDVTTGRHCLNDQICQIAFAVSVEGDAVFVDVG